MSALFVRALASGAGLATVAGIGSFAMPPAAHAAGVATTNASSTCHVPPTIRYGSHSNPVKWAQWRLGVTSDGYFGPQTLRAVKAFQIRHHLAVDGIVGPITWRALPYGLPGCATPPVKPPVTVKTVTRYVVSGINFLSVRTGPGTNYSQVGELKPGTKLVGTVTSNNWFHITSGTASGRYVANWYLTATAPVTPKPPVKPTPPAPPVKPTPPAPPVTPPVAKTYAGYATSDDVRPNVRSGPGFNYGVVSSVAAHSRVSGTLVGDGPWVKISSGYINRGTLENKTSNPSSINGNIPTADLCRVPLAYNANHSFAPGYTVNTQRYLNCDALAGLNSLESAYKAHFGTWATIDLTYRSFAEQQYWYNKFGSPRAAVPGTSNHGYGLAIDFQENDGYSTFDWGQPGWSWLNSNAGNYGFNNPFSYGTSGESYHHNFKG